MMKKIVALLLSLVLLASLAGCNRPDAVLDEIKSFEVTSEIRSLHIRINAADFVIREADAFAVESNLKYLTVSERNGVLMIVENVKNGVYDSPVLTLYVPAGTAFDHVDMQIGAAKMTVDTLAAKTLALQIGAGAARFDNLEVSSCADIEGGAGELTIFGGTLNDLDLELGMGELNLTAALLGRSDLELGVGRANLTLVGGKEAYALDITKGLGSITVDGQVVSDFGSSGNGQNRVEIDGGVGAINISFKQ